MRRRRLALGGVALAALVVGVIAGARSEDGAEPDGSASGLPGGGPAAVECPSAVVDDPRLLAGQMLVVRIASTATPALLRRIEAGELAGVVVFPVEGTRPAGLARTLESVHRAAERGGQPTPVVAIDQEGGEVERLPELPPRTPPSGFARIGAAGARAEGRATGEALARIGVNVDLAPVLDVPAGPGAFIGSRSISADPGEVAVLGTAFGAGLESAGVAATAKHFPGLGRAAVNSDESTSVVEAGRRELETDLVPFEAAVDGGFDLVMTANATYPELDRRRPASLSRPITTGLLREELGFDGVIITDDLGAGAITAAGIAEPEAAVAAAEAGADLLLFALSDGTEAWRALRRGLRDGTVDRDEAIESCARSAALRARLVSPPRG